MATAYETKLATKFYTKGPRPGPVEAIVIHHWGPDGQSFDNVRDFLASPTKDREVSAHKVIQGSDADGTPNPRVARIVNDEDIAWQAGSWPGNQVTIGFECRPEATDADYEAVAAEIRAARAVHGDIPIRPHRYYTATECPGRWDLDRLDRLARQENPMAHKSVIWRGVVVCEHTVPKLDAWAKSTGPFLVRPIPGCGSRQTSTKASAGTHAGGGAIDVYAPASASERALHARKAREFGLQVGWGRAYIAGVWSNHFHLLDPACSELAKAAVSQIVEFGNGGDGLVGNTPDAEWRGNKIQLMTIFAARFLDVADQVVAVVSLQNAVHQTPDSDWGEKTDIDLGNTRAAARDRRYFSDYRWSDTQRKQMQHSWGTAEDGKWGTETDKALTATIKKIQLALGVGADAVWGPVTDAAFLKVRGTYYKGKRGLPAFVSLTKPVAATPPKPVTPPKPTVKPVDYSFPYTRGGPKGFYPWPGKVGASYYGPSKPNVAWYSGKAAGGLNTGTWASGGLSRPTIQDRIKKIQKLVGASVDGDYGDKTADAVRSWQKSHKVTSDGIVGPKTWTAMAASKGQ